VRIETDVETLGALVYEGGDLDEALRSGDVEIGGDRSAVGRLTDLFPLPEPVPKPASSTVASSRSSTTRQCRPDEPTKQRRRRPIVGGSTPTQGDRMKTLLVAYRVADLDRSLDFYTTLGYTKVGTVALDGGDRLAILKFPDEPAATLELVHRPGGGRVDVGSGFDHLAIQVDTLAATLKRLTEAGLEPRPVQHPAGPRGPMTSWLTDPDGYRIELVEWPPGHPDGITAADFS
jgi:lactoylglutathione lyase